MTDTVQEKIVSSREIVEDGSYIKVFSRKVIEEVSGVKLTDEQWMELKEMPEFKCLSITSNFEAQALFKAAYDVLPNSYEGC